MTPRKVRTGFLLVLLPIVIAAGFWAAFQDSTDGEQSKLVTRLTRQQRPKAEGNRRQKINSVRKKSRKPAVAVTTSAATAKKQPEARGVFRGLVTTEAGTPLTSAALEFRSAENSSILKTFTSGDGRFVSPPLPYGSWHIIATHEHFAPAFSRGVPLHEKEIEVNLRLPLGALFKGIVVDLDQKPVPSVRVTAHVRRSEQMHGGGHVYLDDFSYRSTDTDTSGAFEMKGVSIGENRFIFAKTGYDKETCLVNVQARVQVPYKVVLKTSGRIAGRIVDEEGKPVSSATLALLSYKPFGENVQQLQKGKFSAQSDTSGTFTFTRLFNEGFYDMGVEHPEFALTTFTLISAGTEGMTCVLERGGEISGRTEFIDRDTTPASVLLAATALIRGTTFTRQMRSSGDGLFHMNHLPYGSYRLGVDSEGYASEPRPEVPSIRGKPSRNVLVEVYQSCTVVGTVADAQTNSAIAEAKASVSSSYGKSQSRKRTAQVSCDQHGSFILDHIPAGSQTAQASAPGYSKIASGLSVQAFSLLPAERKEGVTLLLGRGGTVDGTVKDSAGKAISGCHVQLFNASTALGSLTVKDLHANTTQNGYFRISGVPLSDTRELYASATKSGYAKTRSNIIALSPTDPEATIQIVVTAGQGILGRVTDLAGQPLANVSIKAVSREFSGDPDTVTLNGSSGSDGRYGVPYCTPGRVRMTVTKSGYVQQIRDVTVGAQRALTGVNFKLEAGNSIRGKVQDLEQHPIAGATVRAIPNLKTAVPRMEASTNRSGEFVLRNLPKAEYLLEASFTLTTSDGSQKYVFSRYHVPCGSISADIDCDLANSATGEVQTMEHKPISTFKVVLRSKNDLQPPQEFRFNLERSFTRTGGKMRILNAPRGDYCLEVAASGYETAVKDPVHIGPSRHTVLPTVLLRSAGGITGTVYSTSTGRPVSGISVRALDLSKPDSITVTKREMANYTKADVIEYLRSDDDTWAYQVDDTRPLARIRGNLIGSTRTPYTGDFTIGSIPAGTCAVEFDSPKYQKFRLDQVEVFPDKTTDLGTIYIDAGGGVRGAVTDAYGSPVSSALVYVSGLIPEKKTYTDLAGNYIFQGIPAGLHTIVVRGTVLSRKVYAFQPVSIQPDEVLQTDFLLELSAELTGSVASDGVARITDVRVFPFNEYNSIISDICYTGSVQGQTFAIRSIPPGVYFLTCSGSSVSGSYTTWRMLNIGRGSNPATLRLPAASVRGQVFSAAGTPVQGILLRLQPVIIDLPLPGNVYNPLVRSATSGRKGVFGFAYLSEGSYQLIYYDRSNPAAGWQPAGMVSLGEGQKLTGFNVSITP